MAISFGTVAGDGEDQLVSTINTTPLVDVMLVLLIIFLITIPVVTQTVPVTLPKDSSIPTQTKPENINISVDRDGKIFWNQEVIEDRQELTTRLTQAAKLPLQPEIHIRGDQEARYESVGRLVALSQKAGIAKVGFITEPSNH